MQQSRCRFEVCAARLHRFCTNYDVPPLKGFAVGMDAALQINPYYGKTSMSGLAEHFRHVLMQYSLELSGHGWGWAATCWV